MTSKHLDEDIYQQAWAKSVHYSLKTVNSNIEEGGIRPCAKPCIRLTLYFGTNITC